MTTRSPLQTTVPRPPAKRIKTESNNADDDNFVLIASDDVRFEVCAYHLKSASPVLRDMISVGSTRSQNNDPETRTLQFTDPELERSAVIDLFLSIVKGVSMIPRTMRGIVETREILDLVGFCHKYDAQIVLNIVKMSVRVWINEGHASPISTFIIGSRIPDLHLCCLAIKSPWGTTWTSPKEIKPDPKAVAISNFPVMDLRAAPLCYMELLPHKSIVAMLRASARHPMVDDNQSQREARATEFIRLMKGFATAQFYSINHKSIFSGTHHGPSLSVSPSGRGHVHPNVDTGDMAAGPQGLRLEQTSGCGNRAGFTLLPTSLLELAYVQDIVQYKIGPGR
ncbi:hypothetical protein I317_02836 [Kwoniella heveanensis CBS 569]|nr:hypothetical protein I317_02836 [Kwoniella heveanensis CBS 569]